MVLVGFGRTRARTAGATVAIFIPWIEGSDQNNTFLSLPTLIYTTVLQRVHASLDTETANPCQGLRVLVR
jgi:hypothetical protein